MHIVHFVCPLAPALAQAATRVFNQLADPQKAFAVFTPDPEPRIGPIGLLVTMGSLEETTPPPCDTRLDWPLLDPLSISLDGERAHLNKLARHVSKLIEERGWTRERADDADA